MRTAKLDEIVRQKDPALICGRIAGYGPSLRCARRTQEQGRVKEIPDGEERIRAIAKSRRIPR